MPSNTELPATPDPQALGHWLECFQGTRWIVAYSGGADSSALLHLLQRVESRPPLLAIHVNHGLHPAATQWETHCQQQCAQLGIPLQVERVRVQSQGKGVEAAAREQRYLALQKHMQEGDLLLTAQHENDLAETLLLNLFRGAGLHGLSSLQAARKLQQGWLLRPLLGMQKTQLLHWLQQENLSWVEDPSNAHSGYRRNLLRQQILPQLEQHWPGVQQRLAHSARHLAQARGLLDTQIEEQLQALRITTPADGLQRSALLALEPPMRIALLRHWLQQTQGLYPERKKAEEILAAAQRHDKHAIPWQGMEIHCWKDGLFILPPMHCDLQWRKSWNGRETLQLPGHCGELELVGKPLFEITPWQVHLRQGGERICLAGHAHHRPVKKLLQEQAIPPWERCCLPMICTADGEVLAAGDRWLSASLKAWLEQHQVQLHWHRPWRHRTMPPTVDED